MEPRLRDPRITLLPQTLLGWRAIALLAGAVSCLVANVLLALIAGQRGPGFNPWLAFTIIPAGALAVTGCLVATVAVLRRRERGIVVIFPLAVGAMAVWFGVGEVLVPH